MYKLVVWVIHAVGLVGAFWFFYWSFVWDMAKFNHFPNIANLLMFIICCVVACVPDFQIGDEDEWQ